jgi:proton-coupled amino acid transporter
MTDKAPLSPALHSEDCNEKAPKVLSDVGVLFTLFKANCGCIILYMPRAWANGGYLFSTIVLPVFAFFASACSLRLVRCKSIGGAEGHYGDVMDQAIGRRGRRLASISQFLLQCGICCTFYITCAELLHDTVLPQVPVNVLIMLFVLVWAPMSWVRKVSKLWLCSLFGSLLVIIGALLIVGLEAKTVVETDAQPPVAAFNKRRCFIFIGQAAYVFEGICLVLPTYDAGKNKRRFPALFSLVIAFVTALVVAMGLLGYVAFGDAVSPLVLLDIQDGWMATFVKLAFAFNIIFSYPLQFFPACQVLEPLMFTPMSDPPLERKMRKNALRTTVVAILALVSILGATDLDNFVSLVGAFCGMPLAFVYPSICHLKLVVGKDGSCVQKMPDVLLIVFGILLTVTITVINIATWGQS